MNEVTRYQISASTGKGKIWIIRVDDKGTQSEIVIKSGQFDLVTKTPGKLITNTSIVSEGTNLGKANETTHYEQAVKEAMAKVKLKDREGYVDDVSKVQSSAVLGSGVRKPMLAQKYHPTGKQNGSKTLKQMKIEGQLIYVQPKLDGNRGTIVIDTEAMTGKMYTRKGDLMKVQLRQIIDSALATIAELKKTRVLEPEIVLDGELYADPAVMSFNTLNGLLKDEKQLTLEKAALRKQIKFHIYDVMRDDSYVARYEFVKLFASDSIEVVESFPIKATDANINEMLEKFLELGYEGLMIRTLNTGYENKRTWQLVKVKIFEDREFKLIGFEEDVRGGFVGTFIMELPEKLLRELGKPLVDAQGKPIEDFRAGTSGQTVEDRTYMLQHPSEFIGKMATVEYFGWDYRPRFGKFKGVRD